MAQWFYEKEGKPTGPVSQLELARLVMSGRLKEESLVWTPSFGDQWRTVREAGLPRIVARINALPSSSAPGSIELSDLQPAENSQMGGRQAGKAELSSFWAWMLLLLPFFLEILGNVFLGKAGGDSASSNTVWMLSFLGGMRLAVEFLCMQQDRKKLAEANYIPPSYWWLLFPPGYFLLRWERTKKDLILFLLNMFVLIIALAQVIAASPDLKAQMDSLKGGKPALSLYFPAPSSSAFQSALSSEKSSLPFKNEEKTI